MRRTSPARLWLAKARTALLLCGACLWSTAASAQLTVVTSIPPLAFIAADILGTRGEAQALTRAGDTPHHMTLTPSARLSAARADLLLWVGADLEVTLRGLFADDPRTVTAAGLAGMTLHTLKGHGSHASGTHVDENHVEENHVEEGHAADTHVDLHVWLNTDNARTLAAALAERLSVIAPQDADYFAARLKAFNAEQARLREALTVELADAAAQTPFAVYHDAYQYFEKQFGLAHVLALVVDPERAPTLRELAQTRAAIARANPRCLLVEPDADAGIVATALNGQPLRRVEIDSLGYRTPPGEQHYARFMRRFADDVLACLR